MMIEHSEFSKLSTLEFAIHLIKIFLHISMYFPLSIYFFSIQYILIMFFSAPSTPPSLVLIKKSALSYVLVWNMY